MIFLSPDEGGNRVVYASSLIWIPQVFAASAVRHSRLTLSSTQC